MNNFMIIFLCCIVLCVIGGIQTMTCGSNDPSKPSSTCSNLFGGLGCIICCGSIIYILTRK